MLPATCVVEGSEKLNKALVVFNRRHAFTPELCNLIVVHAPHHDAV